MAIRSKSWFTKHMEKLKDNPLFQAECKINELEERLATVESELSEARAKSSRLEARCWDLQEENERLRAALKRIADWPNGAQSRIANSALREVDGEKDKILP